MRGLIVTTKEQGRIQVLNEVLAGAFRPRIRSHSAECHHGYWRQYEGTVHDEQSVERDPRSR